MSIVDADVQRPPPRVDESAPPLLKKSVSQRISARLLDEQQTTTIPPDAGFGWVIVLLSFCVHFVVLGTAYSFAIFFEPIKADLSINSSQASWILSTNQCTLLLIGPLAGRLIERFGFRINLLAAASLYSVFLLCASFSSDVGSFTVCFGLMGFAGGLAFNVGIQSVLAWFSIKRRSIGIGLAASGSGLGNFVVPFIASSVLAASDWRVTLRWFALFSFVILTACGLLVRRRMFVAVNAAQRAANNRRALAQLRRAPFWLMFFGSLFVSLGYITPFLHIRGYGLTRGLEVQSATFLLSGLGIASTFGRVVFGVIADYTSKLWTLRISYVLMALVTLCLPRIDNLAGLATYVAVFGSTAGAFIALVAPVCALYFEQAFLPSLTGMVYVGAAIGNLVGLPIAGALVDAATPADGVVTASSYDNAFFFAGSTFLAAGVCVLLLPKPTPFSTERASKISSAGECAKDGAELESADSTSNSSVEVAHERELESAQSTNSE